MNVKPQPVQSQGRELPTGRNLNSGWIPVAERRPEIGTSCIVWIAPEWGALGPFAAVDRWDEWRESPVSFSSVTVVVGEGWMESDPAEVTHWMPLPPPPTERSAAPTGADTDRHGSNDLNSDSPLPHHESADTGPHGSNKPDPVSESDFSAAALRQRIGRE